MQQWSDDGALIMENQGNTTARIIAFYLPQFHPVPENDSWWGKGFTEWTNVARATPLFRNHVQPHLPADLGFYDLRLPEVREAQADMARDHGIEGFCYWHYWFHGRRLLGKPIDDVVRLGKPDFPFCLAWANEPWSRRWLGEERDVLVGQEHSPEDDEAHGRWLLPRFADPRYVRLRGRPLFLVYRPRHLPDPKRTTDVFRDACVKAGLPEPCLLGIDGHCRGTDCRHLGFDGTVRFEPQLGALPEAFDDAPTWGKFRRNLLLGIRSASLKVYDYEEARRLMNQDPPGFPVHPCIFVGWDNTPRRGAKGIVVVNNTPQAFGAALQSLVASVSHKSVDDRLVFVNAWNEWAEGNHLEPDHRYGMRFLEEVRRVNRGSP
jgi:lipopolysaccharide biosynthesis protein